MSWVLGGITLPDPSAFKLRFVEKTTYHEMINGRSAKDVTNRKEQYELRFERIDQNLVSTILSLHAQQDTLDFSVTDGSLIIGETDVHVDISGRDYNTKGSEFREDITMILTEVQ